MSFSTSKPYTFDRTVRLIIFVAIIWGVLKLLNYLSDVLIPFAVALVLAYLLNPLVVFIQHRLRVKNRIASVIITLLLVFGSLTLLLTLLIPRLVRDTKQMGFLVGNYVNNSALRYKIESYFPKGIQEKLDEFTRKVNIEEFLKFENLETTIDMLAQKILPGAWGVFSGSLSILITILGITIIGLYLIFILKDYDLITTHWKKMIPSQYRTMVVSAVSDMERSMNTYFRAQASIALIVGILIATGFSIIGLPMGIALGLFIGFLNLVPYLQIVGFIPASFFALLYSLETGGSFWVMIGLVILVQAIVQVIQDVILVPKIMGNATGLNPAIILLSLSIWGKLLGILGLIIALPLTSVIIGYYNRFLHSLEQREGGAAAIEGVVIENNRKPEDG
ncbi:MAG: AI-2E family transporter [Sphingobacteriales bacterium]|nr:MAG: AI-2E family transporter [Sphingobacteriales bacterium]